MNHQQWKEWVNLLAYEELDVERKRLTEEHYKRLWILPRRMGSIETASSSHG